MQQSAMGQSNIIIYSTDHNGIVPAYVSIKSLFENTPKEKSLIVEILINDSVTDEDKALLDSLSSNTDNKINFFPVNDIFSNSFEKGSISKATYYRLMIPWLFPENDKVIYIDIDTIVLDDITPLYSVTDGDYWLWGARDLDVSLDSYSQKKIKHLDVSKSDYINAGVLVINCKELRRQDLKKTFLDYGERKFFFQDQDIINIVCKGKIGRFPARYNYLSNQLLKYDKKQIIESGILDKEEYSEAISAPVVIHYAGPKPWNDFTPMYREWWRVYENTPLYSRDEENAIESVITKKIYIPNISTAIRVLLSKIKRGIINQKNLNMRYIKGSILHFQHPYTAL